MENNFSLHFFFVHFSFPLILRIEIELIWKEKASYKLKKKEQLESRDIAKASLFTSFLLVVYFEWKYPGYIVLTLTPNFSNIKPSDLFLEFMIIQS